MRRGCGTGAVSHREESVPCVAGYSISPAGEERRSSAPLNAGTNTGTGGGEKTQWFTGRKLSVRTAGRFSTQSTRPKRSGGIWHLGKHTVICGDSTDPDVYQKLLGDTKVNLVCTDAPYFVKLENASGTIKNDDLDDKSAYEFLMKVYATIKNARRAFSQG